MAKSKWPVQRPSLEFRTQAHLADKPLPHMERLQNFSHGRGAQRGIHGARVTGEAVERLARRLLVHAISSAMQKHRTIHDRVGKNLGHGWSWSSAFAPDGGKGQYVRAEPQHRMHLGAALYWSSRRHTNKPTITVGRRFASMSVKALR